MPENTKAKVYTRYPKSSVLVYEVTTILHYLFGGAGIMLGYGLWAGYLLGSLYLAFAFVAFIIG